MKLIIILFSFIYGSLEFNKEDVVYALNSGSPRSQIDQYGIVYRPDPKVPKDASPHCGIQGWLIQDVNIYCLEYWASNEVVQRIPLEGDGKYTLNLKFAEVAFYQANIKVFDIKIGDTVVKQNVDIFKEVGFAQPYDLFFEFKLKNGAIYLKNDIEAPKAYDKKKGEMIVKLTKVIGEPRLMGIVVTKGPVERSTKDLYNQEIKKINQKIEQLRKQREQLAKGDMGDQKLNVPFDGEINEVDAADYPSSLFDQLLGIPYLLEGAVFGSVFVFLFFIEKCPDL